MRMAQGEKLVKKWECRDEGEKSSGSTVITVTDRRVATERVSTVGTQTDKFSQEILLDSVKGVSYANQKRTKINWWVAAGILVGILLFIILYAEFENNYLEERIAIHFAGLVPSIVLIAIGLVKQKNLFVIETDCRIIIYTDATCTFNMVGELSFGVRAVATDGAKVFIPVSYEVAQDVAETIGAYLVEAKYGAHDEKAE